MVPLFLETPMSESLSTFCWATWGNILKKHSEKKIHPRKWNFKGHASWELLVGKANSRKFPRKFPTDSEREHTLSHPCFQLFMVWKSFHNLYFGLPGMCSLGLEVSSSKSQVSYPNPTQRVWGMRSRTWMRSQRCNQQQWFKRNMDFIHPTTSGNIIITIIFLLIFVLLLIHPILCLGFEKSPFLPNHPLFLNQKQAKEPILGMLLLAV